MSITAKYILVCDDFRQENNGKFIIIGLYTPDMVVPQIPFVLPTLTFFMNLESDRPGNFGFRMKIQHQDSGNILGQGMGMIPVPNPQGPIISPVKMGGVLINAQGLYTFSIEIDGNKEPLVASFNVLLGNPGIPQMAQLGRL